MCECIYNMKLHTTQYLSSISGGPKPLPNEASSLSWKRQEVTYISGDHMATSLILQVPNN